MRTRNVLGVWIVCATAFACAPAATDAARVVRVGVYENSPKIATGRDGHPEGIFIDLIEAVAAEEKWALRYVPGTWAEGLDRLAAGGLDLMPDVALTRDREALFAFHREPALSDWFQVYARRGSGIRSILDLHGRRVSVLERSIQQEAFGKAFVGFDLNVKLVPLPDFASAFAAAAQGSVDAVIANRFYGTAHLRQYQLEDTAIIFNPTRLFFAASRSADPALLSAIDRNLVRLKRDPTSVYYRSLRRWTSEDEGMGLPSWLRGVGAAFAGLLVLSVVWSVSLRRRVAVRTRELALRNEELQRSGEQFRLIMENLADLVAVLDPEGRRLYNSPSYAAIIGDPAGLRGTCSFDEVHPEDKARVEAAFRETVRTGVGTRLEYRLVDARGGVHHIESQGSVVRDAAGRVSQVVVVSRDITERRMAEEAIRELNAGLERRVAERTAELAVARDRAEAADRTKSAFLATMSHELRTPLNSIIGFTGILLQDLAGPLNPEQRKQLEMVRDSSRHLLALINDVLDISKIEAGQLTVVAEPYDLRGSIMKVAGLVRPLAGKKGLELRVELSPEIGPATGDARRVEQILLNLLNNAVKFTERGGVRLRAETVADGLGAGRPAVRISVEDTGIGIDPGDMETLFQPFRQIDTGLSRQHEGTGLGLAICRRLAGLMGGTIGVGSERGKGSVFTVLLPADGTEAS